MPGHCIDTAWALPGRCFADAPGLVADANVLCEHAMFVMCVQDQDCDVEMGSSDVDMWDRLDDYSYEQLFLQADGHGEFNRATQTQ